MLDEIKLISEIKMISNNLLFLSFNEIKNRLDRIVRNYEDSERILQILKNVKENPINDKKMIFKEYLKLLTPDICSLNLNFENNKIKYNFNNYSNYSIDKDIEETIRKKMSESDTFKELKEYFEKPETFEDFQNFLVDLDENKHTVLLKNLETYHDFFKPFYNSVNVDGQYEYVTSDISKKINNDTYINWEEKS